WLPGSGGGDGRLLQAHGTKAARAAEGGVNSLTFVSEILTQVKLTQSVTTDIKYLTEGRYKARKTGQKGAIEERLASIRSSLDAVNMSYALKAAIYYSDGETDAMLKCLEQYADFIGKSIASKSRKLAELDSTDKLPKGGFWEEKALALEAVGNIRGLLCEPDEAIEVLALESPKESENVEG
ncbi:hypothetical protein, partial [Paraeggerthella hongkongensis]|uniref:hypothetical protein n=1 Tax=Paraeggerthella hongkongensis TaxID=230658 RepID=UPI001374C1E8